MIVLTHGYSDSNKGDVAIALGTVAVLRRAMPEASILSHSGYSEAHVDFRQHTRWMTREGIPVAEGVLPSPYLDDNATGRWRDAAAMVRLARETFCLAALLVLPRLARLHPRKARALAALRRASLVVARGGQYLHNESGRVRGAIFLLRMLINLAVPVGLGRPTVVLGMSLGPFHGALARRLATAVLRGCRLIVVREPLSAEFLRARGLSATARLVPDLAFVTTPTRTSSSRLPEQTWLGVTLVNWDFPGHLQPSQALAEYVEAVLHGLEEIHAAFSLVPLLVPQVTVGHHGRHDRSLQEQVAEQLHARRVPAKTISADLSPGELCDVFGQCRLVLASRLHSVILAACAGTPSVAIRYQGYKTQGISSMLSTSLPVHEIDSLDADKLTASLRFVLAQREALSAELRARVVAFREQIRTCGDEIASIAHESKAEP